MSTKTRRAAPFAGSDQAWPSPPLVDAGELSDGRPQPGLMLECAGLSKYFGDVAAVSDFNLNIPRGKMVALLGPSGCGKTTALRLIAGFANPDTGTIRIGGEKVYASGRSVPPEKRQVGLVFQEGALFPHLTVEQNISYGLPRDQQRRERVREVVELTGLEQLTRRMPYELSGGQQQRVALARALAPRPELLLLDEPFSNLDPSLREQVRRDVVTILRETGITAIFVTHDQEEAMYVGDTTVVMNQGRIEQQDSPEKIFHRPKSKFVAEFIGTVDFVAAGLEGDLLVTAIGAIPRPAGFTDDAGLEAMVRPDCLDCVLDEVGNGVVTDREFRGAFYLYQVQLDSGDVVRCLRSHIDEYPVGARVAVRMQDGHDLRPFSNGVAVAA